MLATLLTKLIILCYTVLQKKIGIKKKAFLSVVERDSKQTTEENSLADVDIKEKNEKSKNVENVKDNIMQKEKEITSNNSVYCVKGTYTFVISHKI